MAGKKSAVSVNGKLSFRYSIHRYKGLYLMLVLPLIWLSLIHISLTLNMEMYMCYK